MRTLIAAAFFCLGSSAALAECTPPPAQPNVDNISYLLGIEPSDGILDVWCRLQVLNGDYRINVLFPGTKDKENGANKSFEVTFDGTYSHSPSEIADFIQSLLPTEDLPALDENKMNFGQVLEDAVQGKAAKTPNGQSLGIPSTYEFSNELSLWQPVALRIRPVNMAGADFSITINFRPSVGRLMMQLNGEADDLVFHGWHKNVLRHAGPNRDNCPATIPDCKDFGQIIPVRTAWVVQDVTAESYGTSLSAAAITIFNQLIAENRSHISPTAISKFSPSYGQAHFDISGQVREILVRADGDPNRAAGTQAIRIRWTERNNSKLSYSYLLEDYGKRYRDAMILANQNID